MVTGRMVIKGVGTNGPIYLKHINSNGLDAQLTIFRDSSPIFIIIIIFKQNALFVKRWIHISYIRTGASSDCHYISQAHWSSIFMNFSTCDYLNAVSIAIMILHYVYNIEVVLFCLLLSSRRLVALFDIHSSLFLHIIFWDCLE